jgi:hypothetical protein
VPIRKAKYILVLAIDVIPYYIDLKHMRRLQDIVHRWFIVGNNYPTYPGTYTHIDHGGLYTIVGDKNGEAQIYNYPTGTGDGYFHPLRVYTRAQKLINVAHNTAFYDNTDVPC